MPVGVDALYPGCRLAPTSRDAPTCPSTQQAPPPSSPPPVPSPSIRPAPLVMCRSPIVHGSRHARIDAAPATLGPARPRSKGALGARMRRANGRGPSRLAPRATHSLALLAGSSRRTAARRTRLRPSPPPRPVALFFRFFLVLVQTAKSLCSTPELLGAPRGHLPPLGHVLGVLDTQPLETLAAVLSTPG